MKYRIIGADGNTYGPVSLEQIRQWLAEGRVDNRSPVYVEGAANWTYVGLLPEFAPPPTPAPSPTPIGTIRPVATYRGTNGLATAGLVCSLLAWTLCCCCGGFPLNILGLIFSIIALVQINSQADPQNGRAFAIIGVVLSALSLAFGMISVILPGIENPGSFHWTASF
jgi:hypothetical protein